ncbi:MAG: T9SS type A sorting domain-containing protein [Salinivirgaceae bacterium]|nr:T9SS type A sorting domain-containing protein [Salinivirgaceae bacterium]
MKKNILQRIMSGMIAVMFATTPALADTFTSVASGDFSAPATWGVSLTSAEMLAATQTPGNTFVISGGYTVTIGDSVNVNDLTVTNGTLAFGKTNDNDLPIIVNGAFTVGADGHAVVSDIYGAHTLHVKQGFTSSGEVNFHKGTGKSVNVIFDGANQTVAVNEEENKTLFSNFTVATGTVTASNNLTIKGSLSINNGATLNVTNKTIRLTGNYTNTGTLTYKGSTIVFDGRAVQSVSVSGDNAVKFNAITVSGGGFLVISNDVKIFGDFLITGNSTVSSSANLIFYANFTVDEGSKYDTNTGYTDFGGEGGSKGLLNQTIRVDGEATCNVLRFYCNEKSGEKTYIGNINATSYVRVYKNTRLVDVAGDYHHTFVGAIVTGDMELQNPMTIRGGTLRYHDGASTNGEFSLGKGNITIQTNDTYVKAGDTFNVKGNITVESGSFVLNGNAEGLQAEVVGNTENTLTVASGARLYIRGRNDNFPKNFASVNLHESSTTYYDSKFNQEVHGGEGVTYGTLYLDYYDKTFNGPTTIMGHLYMYPMTNGSSTVDFGDYSHTLCYHFYDNPDRKGTTSLVSNGTITLKSTGSHGQTIYKRTAGTYTFKNLIIENDDPTYAQTKTIGGEITVNGALTMTNRSDNAVLYLALDINDNVINGSKTLENVFTMGSNTRILVSGENNLGATFESFGDVRLDNNSIVQFDATKIGQIIPPANYGNVYIYGSTAKTIEQDLTIKGWIDQSGYTPKLTITDEDVRLTIEGDWKLGSSYLNINKDATVIFNGEDQEIAGTTLPNVEICGSGIKTLKSTLTVEGDFSVFSGTEFNADNRTINLYGDFYNTDGGGGKFHQLSGRINLRGDGYNQTIECASITNTQFQNFYIEKTKNDTVRLNTDVYVGGNLMTATNRGSLDIANHTLTIGGDLYFYQNCNLIHTDGSKLHFNSATIEQTISNGNTNNTYPTMQFTGGALKRPATNAFDIDGDVIIDNGAIVTTSVKLKVSGNWQNAGTFNHSSEVEFDGADQMISGSAFNQVTFGGTGIKRLSGMINLTGWLKIDSLATLDVSPDDGDTYNNIALSGAWYNNIFSPSGKTGQFVPRKGTVTFTGNNAAIYTGDTLDFDGNGKPGKAFYDVVVNLSDPTYYRQLYPLHLEGEAREKSGPNDMNILNDFTINNGIFYVYWNTIHVGGNLRNVGGTFSMNSHYKSMSKLILGSAPTAKYLDFDPGASNTIRRIVIANGGKYNLMNDYTQYGMSEALEQDSLIDIKNGEFNLNHHTITFNETGNVLIEENGTLQLDSAAVLSMYSNRYLINKGTLKLMGHPNSPAKIQPGAATWYYYIIQEKGTLWADQYSIEGTRTNGLEIQGGTIHPTHNLCNGTFSNSTGNALLTLTGLDLGTGITVDNVTFNVRESSPSANVQRTSGEGTITFTNYSGTLAGKEKEKDIVKYTVGEGLIIWKAPTGFVWTGGGGIDNSWHTGANWDGGKVPTVTDNVILDHTKVVDDYIVKIDKRANVNNLTIEEGVTVNLVGIEDANFDGLEVEGKLTMMEGSTLSQADKRDSLILHGTWNCSGNYSPNGVPAVFDVRAGTHQLTLNKNVELAAMIVNSRANGTLSLSGEVKVADSIRIEAGTLANTNTISLRGDWIEKGGLFDMGESIVNFCSADKEQFVNGGHFWEIRFSNAGKKTITKDISVERTFRIFDGATLVSAGTQNIYLSGRQTNWLNKIGKEAFEQIGDGAVICNGGTSYLGDTPPDPKGTTKRTYYPTTFNNIVLQGTGTKVFRDTAYVKGSVEMVAGIDVTLNRKGAIIGTTLASSFTSYGGALLIYGEDNFPKNMNTIELNAGTVYYRDSIDQVVFPTQYSGLYLYNYYFTTYGIKDEVTKTLADDITVTGSIVINDSITTFVVGDHTITLTGNLSLATGGKQIDWGTDGTVVHVGGTWDVDADIKVLNNVYKKGTGYLYANNEWTVNGNLELDPETRFYMRGNKVTGKAGKTFKLGVNCQLHSAVPKGENNDVAFPLGFGNVEIDETTSTYLVANEDQILYDQVEYGNVYLNNSVIRTVELGGDITVRGNFYVNNDCVTLDDKGHELHLRGATNDLRNYEPTSTVYLESDGDQQVTAGGNFTLLKLNNLSLSGSGVKEINETNVRIMGDINIASGTTFSCNDPIDFSGSSITNNGVFRHYGSTFTFSGAKHHEIRMGVDNIFNSFTLSDGEDVSIVDNGISVNTGVFSLGKNARLDMGTYTHKIASSQIDQAEGCEWITAGANLTFNRGGAQAIPELTCRNIQFSGSGTKTLNGSLNVANLTIDEGVTFSVGSDANNSHPVTLTGDWLCSGSFTSQNDIVYFESTDTKPNHQIKSNGQSFNAVDFNKTTSAANTFSLLDEMSLKDTMEIGPGAKLNLNKNILTIGNDDANSTEIPFVPAGEKITVKSGGELCIDGGAVLRFNHMDDNTRLDVFGTLTMVGSSEANAVITRSSSGYDGRGTAITIYEGGHLAANYYQIQYLAPQGFVVKHGATIDETNNLSNGIWSNMYTSKTYTSPADNLTVYDRFVYLTIEVEEVKNPIMYLAFNHGGTPVQGSHFNIARSHEREKSITLGGTINGTMGFKNFEVDRTSDEEVTKIIWPAITQTVWTGFVSTDWFNKNNWMPRQVPTDELSVRIPLTANAPIIYKEGAVCKNLTIVNGSLTIEDFAKTAPTNPSLDVQGSVDVQNGGVLAVENSADIRVIGDWSIADKGYFVPQNGTVRFSAGGGSVSIVPRKSDFNNVVFDGSATYMLMGSAVKFNGDFTISGGIVWPSTSNYVYTIKGDYNISGGSFNRDITGYVKFAGANQTITNGCFSRVRFANAGIKTLAGTFDASYNNSTRTNWTIIVEDGATMKASAGCALNIKGNILINSGTTFDDGNQTHTFTGYYWEAPGAYTGSGKVVFSGNHAQYIRGGHFHNVDMTLSTKYINDDVVMTGNLNTSSCTLDMLVSHITGSGTFTAGEKTNVYARGADNYPKFSDYEVNGTSIYAYYNGPMNQTIRAAKYCLLYLNSNTNKTLEGDVIVTRNLYFYDNGGTLFANNKNIYLGGHWYNQYSGRFVPGTGRVIFNGTDGTQCAYLGVSVDNPFYDVEVNKPENQQFYASSVDLDVQGSLYVTSGKMSCSSGFKVRVGGNVTVAGSGVIAQSGSYELCRQAGECRIQTNGSILNDLIINGETQTVFKLNDALTVYGNFTLQKGIFDQNGYVATLGNSLDNILIYGTYKVTPGGKLRIGSNSSLVVKSGGVFDAVGDEVNYAQITNNSDRYFFTVESGGKINAEYYNFAYLAKQGLIISDGAIIDGYQNFSNGVFSNVVSGGICLDIRNTQDMTGTGGDGRIKNISFPNNPGGGAVNIKKVEAATGNIEVYNATGLLAGELYENDPYNLITWTGDIEYIWTAGSVSDKTNWFNPANWRAQLAGETIVTGKIPSTDNNVTIPQVAGGNYPIITCDSACAKRLTIGNNAQLTIQITTTRPDTVICALTATSDVTVNGTLTMVSELDSLRLYGNWVIGTKGKLNAGNGTIEMTGVGVKTVQNKMANFNNFVINNNGTIQAQSVMKVGGNFLIKKGTFDVSSYDVTVGGDYINEGVFSASTKTLILNGVGSHEFNPGSSTYCNIAVKNGAYSLTDNELYLTRNLDIDGGTLNVAGNIINLGDGTGIDNVNITNGGLLAMGVDGKLKMGSNAIVNANSGGTLSLLGVENHEAIITSQTTSGTYAVNIGSEGRIAARNYKVERINASGVHLLAGSVIDGTDNLSDGQYVSGAAGGRYLWFENSFGGAADTDTIKVSNVYFNAGPAHNVKRSNASTNGVITIIDAVGVVASYYFEEEDPADGLSANGGAIVWDYTGDVLYWRGNHARGNDTDGTRWDNPDNWENPKGVAASPTSETRVFINQQSHGKYPIIYADNYGGDAFAAGIDIYEGACLTQNAGHSLTVGDAALGISIGTGATFTAKDVVTVKGQFTNAGTFDHGGSSTIIWESKRNRNIEMNNCAFYNFTVKNDDNASVTFAVERGKSLEVKNHFTIESGTVDCNGGTLEVGGNFTNNNGTFVHGSGTVKLNGASNQTISSSNGALSFYNLELIGSGSKLIDVSLNIDKDITVGTAVSAPTADIICHGDWKRPTSGSQSNNFTGGSGWVKFVGTTIQNIAKPETFTNIEINNSSPASILTTYIQTISGNLKLTRGILTGNESNPIRLTSTAVIDGGSPTSYINGSVEKDATSGDFFFPIGGSDRYAPIEINEISGTYRAIYHSETPANRTNLENNVNRVSQKEYWTLTSGSGALPKVKLYWQDSVFSELTDFDVVSVVLYNAGKWQRQGAGGRDHIVPIVVGDTSAGHIFTQEPIDAFGNLTFGFTYPTIIWKDNAATSEYKTKANWEGKHAPSSIVNILVKAIADGKKHPIAAAGVENACYDMTIESGGILELADNAVLTVNGNATIDGTLRLGKNSQILFMRDVNARGAEVLADEGSMVRICGKTEQPFELSSCYNLIIEGGKDSKNEYRKILGNNVVINGSLSIDNYTELDAGTHEVTLKGNLTINTYGKLAKTNSTFVLAGEKKQILSITPNRPLYNLTINNTGSADDGPQIDLGTGIVVNGNLQLEQGLLHSASSARLKLGESATSSLGKPQSYVVGEMEKTGQAPFVFPIGSTERLAQLGVSGITKSTSIIAEYSNKKPVSVANLDADLEKVSHLESWNISSGGSTEAYLTLYWTNSVYNEINNLSTLLVSIFDGSKWVSVGQTSGGSKFNSDNSGYIQSGSKVAISGKVTPRSMRQQTTRRTLNSAPHVLSDGGGVMATFGTTKWVDNPLPIELVSFEAVVADNNTDVSLVWTTASEHNNAYFTIEHMFDGELVIVDTIAARGGAGEGADYSYLHINQPVGTHYYRLLQTDFDGQTTVASEWSAVVIESSDQQVLSASVAPNPGKCQNIRISVKGIGGGKLRYVVADMSGQTIIDRTIGTAGMSSILIDAADWNLQPSVYLIKVFTDNGQTVSKFVVE